METNKIYCIDNIAGMSQLGNNTVQLILTSPPYADMRKYQDFKGIHPDKYVDWFLPIGKEIFRILNDGGSFVLNINDKVVNGFRHTYVFSLVLELEKLGFNLWERFFWNKPNPMPGMGGKRFRDATEYIFWFSKGKPYVDMKSVKVPSITHSKNKIGRPEFEMSRSGSNFTKRETSERFPDMVVPLNVLTIKLGNSYKTAGNHPAIFPEQIPEFFIKSATKKGDLVLDPFSGSGTTCLVAKKLERQYIGFDITEEYVQNSNRRLSE